MDSSSTKVKPSTAPNLTDVETFSTLSGGGEMGALIRSFDWSQTSLGAVSEWPESLKTAVRIILTSRYAMFVWWGRELINIYNDPYRAFLGIKHPRALGKSAREVWSEIWEEIGPRTDAVLLRGESTYDEALLLLMERHGYLEETYFTFSYSPLPEDEGKIGGLFCAVTEVTDQVIGERRLRLLREVAAVTSRARTPEEVCIAAGECLVNARRDLPFSLIYLVEGDGKSLRRTAHIGIGPKHAAAPESFDLSKGEETVWPFRQVMETGEPVLVENLGRRFADLPSGEWEKRPTMAVLMPMAQQGQTRPAGIFVAGLNPHRAYDDELRGFVSVLTNQMAGAIANAVAYESERRRAEQLAELDRAKTQFFSNVSHEFRTPLTLMLGPIEEVLPEAQERLSPRAQEHLIAARKNSLRLLKLVNTLLDFSRIEAGRAQAAYEAVDICSVTKEIASVFRAAIERAGLRYRVSCEPITASVYVDRDMWEKIVLNLLSNAFKFTFEGEIAVALAQADGHVELTVRDTGVGIPEEEQGRVFERFHRIENSRSRTFEGTGIGLALVQELVRLHGGSVQVKSKPGEGSTFSVTIPCGKEHLPAERVATTRTRVASGNSAAAFIDEVERWLPAPSDEAIEQTSEANDVTPQRGGARETIVVADDNADMREYLTHLLGEDYQVHAVGDGVEALEAARGLRPSLILADVMMPRADGFELLRTVREDAALREIPVILLSARAGEESRVEGLNAGADDYLIKPFTARELKARVATHRRMYAMRQQATRTEARLRAEAQLERNRLEELLKQAPAAIGLLSGPNHIWTYVNDLYVKVTGRKSAADFIGKTIRESLPEIETQPYLELLDNVFQSGRCYAGREGKALLNRGPDGTPETAYFDFVYQPIFDVDGKVEGILVHAVDVTDKVEARERIEASEARLRLAQSAAQIGTWEWDPTRKVQLLSPELHETFGTEAKDPDHARMWESRVHPGDRAHVYRSMEEGYRAGKMEFEYRYEHPEKGLRWLYCKGSRIEPDTRMLGIVLDVTERKKTQHKLEKALIASRRLAAIVNSSDDAIASKDLKGIVTSWNRSAEKMFGYTAEEMIGQSILKVIPPELHGDEDRILSTIARGDRIEHFETVRLRKDGTRFDISLTVSPVKDESGRIVGAAKIARDITQRKKAEQALRTTERLATVGRLAATVAHEINNPLEAVTNLVFLARTSSSLDEVRTYLKMAEEELDRVSHLTKQTLGFYRETRGASAIQVGSLVAPLVTVFSARAKNKGIQIRQELREHGDIRAVPGEIRRVLANLISNSIDAVDTGGVVRVRVSRGLRRRDGTRGVRITVADSGSGIPGDVRRHLFEPFFTTKKDVGTGLGLWVCKSVVENHGGEIRLRSCTTPGRSGTVFSVFLPENAQPVEQDFRRAV